MRKKKFPQKEFEELDAEFKRCEENKDLEGLAKINLTINDYIISPRRKNVNNNYKKMNINKIKTGLNNPSL